MREDFNLESDGITGAEVASLREMFGADDIISSYSRAQAIEDGILVNLNDPSFTFRPNLNICAEVGIKFPVAMTIAAFAKTVQAIGEPLPTHNDLSGRMWDVLYMFKLAARQGGTEIHYRVSVTNWVRVNGKRINRTKQETVTLKAVCGPGDDASPVITIMLPDED